MPGEADKLMVVGGGFPGGFPGEGKGEVQLNSEASSAGHHIEGTTLPGQSF